MNENINFEIKVSMFKNETGHKIFRLSNQQQRKLCVEFHVVKNK